MSEVKPYLFLNYPLHIFQPNKDHVLNYDELSETFVVIQRGKIEILSIFDSISTKNTIRYRLPRTESVDSPVSPLPLLCKMNSHNPSLVGLLLNARTLVILRDRKTLCMLKYPEKKYSNKTIVNFFWITKDHLIAVTTKSVEIYAIRKRFKELKTFKFRETISFCKFHAEFQLFCVVFENKKSLNVIQPFRIGEKALVKLPKLTLSNLKPSRPFLPNEVNLIVNYNICLLIVLMPDTQEAFIYRLQRDHFVFMRKYNLFSPGLFFVQTVDSILIFHNTFNHYSLAFDILAEQSIPVAPPMSIAQYQEFLQKKSLDHQHNHSSSSLLESKEKEKGEGEEGIVVEPAHKIELYDSSWRYFSPNLILCPKSGTFLEINISLLNIPLTIKDKEDKIKFLFRRLNSKFLLKNVLRDFLLDFQNSFLEISSIFRIMNHFYYESILCGKIRNISLIQSSSSDNSSSIIDDHYRSSTSNTPSDDEYDNEDGGSSSSSSSSSSSTAAADEIMMLNGFSKRTLKRKGGTHHHQTSSTREEQIYMGVKENSSTTNEQQQSINNNNATTTTAAAAAAAAKKKGFFSFQQQGNNENLGGLENENEKNNESMKIVSTLGMAVIEQEDMLNLVLKPMLKRSREHHQHQKKKRKEEKETKEIQVILKTSSSSSSMISVSLIQQQQEEEERNRSNNKNAHSLSLPKLALVVLEYLRSLIDNRIPIQSNLQNFFVDLLISLKRYESLRQYIHYKMIRENRKTAVKLLNISKEYPMAFDLALQMLVKEKEYEMICSIFEEKKEVLKLMHVIERYDLWREIIQKEKKEKKEKEISSTTTSTIKSMTQTNVPSPIRILELARDSENQNFVFYHVYNGVKKIFEEAKVPFPFNQEGKEFQILYQTLYE